MLQWLCRISNCRIVIKGSSIWEVSSLFSNLSCVVSLSISGLGIFHRNSCISSGACQLWSVHVQISSIVAKTLSLWWWISRSDCCVLLLFWNCPFLGGLCFLKSFFMLVFCFLVFSELHVALFFFNVDQLLCYILNFKTLNFKSYHLIIEVFM